MSLAVFFNWLRQVGSRYSEELRKLFTAAPNKEELQALESEFQSADSNDNAPYLGLIAFLKAHLAVEAPKSLAELTIRYFIETDALWLSVGKLAVLFSHWLKNDQEGVKELYRPHWERFEGVSAEHIIENLHGRGAQDPVIQVLCVQGTHLELDAPTINSAFMTAAQNRDVGTVKLLCSAKFLDQLSTETIDCVLSPYSIGEAEFNARWEELLIFLCSSEVKHKLSSGAIKKAFECAADKDDDDLVMLLRGLTEQRSQHDIDRAEHAKATVVQKKPNSGIIVERDFIPYSSEHTKTLPGTFFQHRKQIPWEEIIQSKLTTIINNIETPTGTRLTSGAGSNKVAMLRNIRTYLNSLQNSPDLLLFKKDAVRKVILGVIKAVCQEKRHTYNRFQPHSVQEFNDLFREEIQSDPPRKINLDRDTRDFLNSQDCTVSVEAFEEKIKELSRQTLRCV